MRRYNELIVLMAASLVSTSALAEEPYVLWARSQPGMGSPGSLATTSAGELCVVRGYAPCSLLKYDTQGVLVASNAVAQLTGAGGILVNSEGATFLAGYSVVEGSTAFC